jgi:hypothetical protein
VSDAKDPYVNPKDLRAAKRVPLHLVPPILRIAAAGAMADGAQKYGPYNWRAKKVVLSVYLDAIGRHIDAYFDGEEYARDSKVHHLSHIAADIAIILDARETGNLLDDRPTKGPSADALARWGEQAEEGKTLPQVLTEDIPRETTLAEAIEEAKKEAFGPRRDAWVKKNLAETLTKDVPRIGRELEKIAEREYIDSRKRAYAPDDAWNRAKPGSQIVDLGSGSPVTSMPAPSPEPVGRNEPGRWYGPEAMKFADAGHDPENPDSWGNYADEEDIDDDLDKVLSFDGRETLVLHDGQYQPAYTDAEVNDNALKGHDAWYVGGGYHIHAPNCVVCGQPEVMKELIPETPFHDETTVNEIQTHSSGYLAGDGGNRPHWHNGPHPTTGSMVFVEEEKLP